MEKTKFLFFKNSPDRVRCYLKQIIPLTSHIYFPFATQNAVFQTEGSYSKEINLPFNFCYFSFEKDFILYDIYFNDKYFIHKEDVDQVEGPVKKIEKFCFDSFFIATNDYKNFALVLFGLQVIDKINIPYAINMTSENLENLKYSPFSHIVFRAINAFSDIDNRLGHTTEKIQVKQKRKKTNKVKTKFYESDFIIVTKKSYKDYKSFGKTKKIDWSYSFKTASHWRYYKEDLKIPGKDQQGNRTQRNRTWIDNSQSVKGKGELKDKIRMLIK